MGTVNDITWMRTQTGIADTVKARSGVERWRRDTQTRVTYSTQGLQEGQRTSVFNHIYYNTPSSSAWVFAYQLPSAVNPLEELTRVQ